MTTTPKINGGATGLPFALDLDRLFGDLPSLHLPDFELPTIVSPGEIAAETLRSEINSIATRAGDQFHVLATLQGGAFVAGEIAVLDGGLIAFRGHHMGQAATMLLHHTQVNVTVVTLPRVPTESRKITGFGGQTAQG
ncbi:MAG: hypothetical protein H2172_16310 [Opitutus sp.]|nr:hypothetical protein [Opitutus sp.]MCS6275914.1 hypothetical protein [Opitutus sp.]MCS6299802.1 hypothetical protein [Opitutus sp.]